MLLSAHFRVLLRRFGLHRRRVGGTAWARIPSYIASWCKVARSVCSLFSATCRTAPAQAKGPKLHPSGIRREGGPSRPYPRIRGSPAAPAHSSPPPRPTIRTCHLHGVGSRTGRRPASGWRAVVSSRKFPLRGLLVVLTFFESFAHGPPPERCDRRPSGWRSYEAPVLEEPRRQSRLGALGRANMRS